MNKTHDWYLIFDGPNHQWVWYCNKCAKDYPCHKALEELKPGYGKIDKNATKRKCDMCRDSGNLVQGWQALASQALSLLGW